MDNRGGIQFPQGTNNEFINPNPGQPISFGQQASGPAPGQAPVRNIPPRSTRLQDKQEQMSQQQYQPNPAYSPQQVNRSG